MRDKKNATRSDAETTIPVITLGQEDRPRRYVPTPVREMVAAPSSVRPAPREAVVEEQPRPSVPTPVREVESGAVEETPPNRRIVDSHTQISIRTVDSRTQVDQADFGQIEADSKRSSFNRPGRQLSERSDEASSGRSVPYEVKHPSMRGGEKTRSFMGRHQGYPRLAAASLLLYEGTSGFAAFLLLTVLKLYLMMELGFSGSASTSFMHAVAFVTFLAIPAWSLVGDMVVSRYKLLLFCCVVYFLGSILVNLSASLDRFISGELPLGIRTLFVVIGMALMSVASGGRSALIAPFSSEQFFSDHKEEEREHFFDFFYLTLNLCVILATLAAPFIRDVHCFGNTHCYPLVLGLSGLAALLLLVFFLVGSPGFLKMGAPGRMFLSSPIVCWLTAVKNRMRRDRDREITQLLDHAVTSGYTKDEVKEARVFFGTLKLLCPLPIYWALYEMSNTRWVDIGLRMNATMPFVNYSIRADALRWINPVLIFCLVPVSAICFTPLAERCGRLCSPKAQICLGFVCMILTYVAITFIAFRVDSDGPAHIPSRYFTLRLIGGQDGGPIAFYVSGPGLREPVMQTVDTNQMASWPGLEAYSAYDVSLDPEGYSVVLTVVGTSGKQGYTGIVTGTPEAPSIKMFQLHDQVAKGPGNRPMIRGVRVSEEAGKIIELIPQGSSQVVATIDLPPPDIAASEYLKDIHIQTYDIRVDGIVTQSYKFFSGGVYSIVAKGTSEAPFTSVVATTPPSTVHILWLLVPIALLTASEFLTSPTALAFFYSEVAPELRSDALRCWFLAMAPGHLFVIIVSGNIFSYLWLEMLLYTVLITLTTLMAIIILARYVSFHDRLQIAFGIPVAGVDVRRSSTATSILTDRPMRPSTRRPSMVNTAA